MIRYAIVRLSSMGDILHSSILLSRLESYHRERGEQLFITWVVAEAFAEVVAHFSAVDEIISIPLPQKVTLRSSFRSLSHFKRERCLHRLRARYYDAIIDPQGLLKSAIIARLMRGVKHIGFSAAESREGSHWWYSTRVRGQALNIIDKNLELLKPLGIHSSLHHSLAPATTPHTPASVPAAAAAGEVPALQNALIRFQFAAAALKHMRQFIKQAGLKRVIVLAPWSTFYTRDLGTELLALIINATYAHTQSPLILSAHKAHAAQAQAVQRSYPQKIILAPPTTLSELFALIGLAQLVIAADSGPAYIAELMGKAVITCFGPTNRERQSPVYAQALAATARSRHSAALMAAYDCPYIKKAPIRTSYRCLNKNCPNDIQCMKQYQNKELLNTLKQVLAAKLS